VSTPFAFLGFSAVVVLLYYASRSSRWRQGVLFFANILFLATFSHGLLSYIPFGIFILAGYAGLRLVRAVPRFAFLPVLLCSLAGFVWLKQYAFVPPRLLLPFVYVTVGLSYILFRILHLMIDTRTGAIKEKIGLVSYLNYTLNFATLSLGPIQLYPAYVNMNIAAAEARLSLPRVAAGLERITRGLFKTNVLSLLFSTVQSRSVEALTSSQPPGMNYVSAVSGLVLYSFFLYCNFSGFIDIVIGVGTWLGLTLPENFDRPFAADNFMDFWTNRWHITLSAWLRMYVYNPLLVTLLRKFPSRKFDPAWAVLAFFITFFLVGIWHGQTAEFLFYGLLLGVGVSGNKVYQLVVAARMGRKEFAKLASNPLYVAISRGLTFTYFTVTLLWFWSSWRRIREAESTLGPGMTVAVCVTIFAGSTVLLSLWVALRRSILSTTWDDSPLLWQCARLAWSTALLTITIVVTLLMKQPAPEIVYKAF
jgi:D-alanyl-lipoteichoic acid acyltransferase DltB (MBOAT superfamily)